MVITPEKEVPKSTELEQFYFRNANLYTPSPKIRNFYILCTFPKLATLAYILKKLRARQT